MKKNFYTLLLLLSISLLAQGQTRRTSISLQHGAHRIGNRTDADMQRWREHGLGQFMPFPVDFGKANFIPEPQNGYAHGRKCPKMRMIICTSSLILPPLMQRHGQNRLNRWELTI